MNLNLGVSAFTTTSEQWEDPGSELLLKSGMKNLPGYKVGGGVGFHKVFGEKIYGGIGGGVDFGSFRSKEFIFSNIEISKKIKHIRSMRIMVNLGIPLIPKSKTLAYLLMGRTWSKLKGTCKTTEPGYQDASRAYTIHALSYGLGVKTFVDQAKKIGVSFEIIRSSPFKLKPLIVTDGITKYICKMKAGVMHMNVGLSYHF